MYKPMTTTYNRVYFRLSTAATRKLAAKGMIATPRVIAARSPERAAAQFIITTTRGARVRGAHVTAKDLCYAESRYIEREV